MGFDSGEGREGEPAGTKVTAGGEVEFVGEHWVAVVVDMAVDDDYGTGSVDYGGEEVLAKTAGDVAGPVVAVTVGVEEEKLLGGVAASVGRIVGG